jgi:type I restriction enzyme S subunit
MELTKTKYKKTEIGLIPEDWHTIHLNQLIDINRHIRYGVVQPGKYEPQGCLMLRSQDYSKGWTNSEKMHRVNAIIENQYKGTKLKHTDLVITIVGAGIAQVVEVPNWIEGALLSRSTARIAVDKAKASYKYIHFYLSSIQGKNQILFGIKEGAQPVVSANDVGNCIVPLPPTLEEQQAIATALSDVDELITNLEKLIAKKKAIKQGAIQQLLTPPNKGGKRLEGYSGEWVETTLGQVCNIKKGQLITDSTRVNGDIPVIAGGKTPAYYHNKPNRFGKTITISGSGASAGYVSFHASPIFASDCSTIEEHKEYSIEFLFYFLQLLQDRIYKMQTGGAQPHIHPSDLNPIKIDLPKKAEQEAIANILREMEMEIFSLESKHKKAESIKQGMMQELLTGKTRLI